MAYTRGRPAPRAASTPDGAKRASSKSKVSAAAAILFDMVDPNPLEYLIDPETTSTAPQGTATRLDLVIAIFLRGVGR